ncbi:MAG: ribosome silencing factor [Phycisphaerales bacterium]|nr:ribosome silencing factor [Phycisphaerales bacterium]
MNEQTNNDPINQNSTGQGTTMSDADGILEVEQAKEFAKRIGSSLLGDKCDHVTILDVTKKSPVTGFIVIASGTSARQMRSALENLDDVAAEFDTSVYQISNDNDALWLLADFIDVVVHVFEPNARSHYDLESMWIGAPRIEVPPFTPPARPIGSEGSGGSEGGGSA